MRFFQIFNPTGDYSFRIQKTTTLIFTAVKTLNLIAVCLLSQLATTMYASKPVFHGPIVLVIKEDNDPDDRHGLSSVLIELFSHPKEYPA
jgi:hypothetical protein